MHFMKKKKKNEVKSLISKIAIFFSLTKKKKTDFLKL